MTDFKPCPFCGDAAAYVDYAVFCIGCGAKIAFNDGSRAHHVATWNRRSTFCEVTALVEAARQCLLYESRTAVRNSDGEWVQTEQRTHMLKLKLALAPFAEKETK